MQEVGNYLEENGYEFLAVNSKRNRSPQFVCVKDKLLFFIVVKGSLYPKSPKNYVARLKNSISKDLKTFNPKKASFYALFIFSNINKDSNPKRQNSACKPAAVVSE